MNMTIEEFAAKLDGREYGQEITRNEEAMAKELGFVVVFGTSDDLAEFRGVIDDEIGCNNGAKIALDENGFFDSCECENCKYYKAAKKNAKVIEAVWCGSVDGPAWTYKTDIPHATFEIAEDGVPYCRGIVFDIKGLEVVEG